MADTPGDLIACLYPISHRSLQHVIQSNKNRLRYAGTRSPSPLSPASPQEHHSSRHERQPTAEPEKLDHLDPPRLELRFSHGPQTRHGFVFGSDDKSDIVLPAISGVSFHHFALTFDQQNRPIVQDLGSLCGTEVTYDERGQGKRRNFRWVVGGDDTPNSAKTIIINIHNQLQFQIVIIHHDLTSQLYRENVDSFRRGTIDTENLLSRLDLPPETERPTGTHTPGTGAIFLQKKLGQGGFGVVTHFWNVSTAEQYALKQPSPRAIKDKDVDVLAWKREANIMGRIEHQHIVRLLDTKFDPWPKLYLEYVPGGSLHDQEHISLNESVQILNQLLSALVYLHGCDPPIVHRDIKSDNILVQYRSAGNIRVKFGDFGLSKERGGSGDWKTVCGTWKYAAPEILDKKRYIMSGGTNTIRYTAAVDIWSLGLVIFDLLCGLPRYKTEYNDGGSLWCQKIVHKLQRDLEQGPNEVIQFLSTTMLILQPELRGSAQMCYDGTLLLSGATQDTCHSPTPEPHYVQDPQATARPCEYNADANPRTILGELDCSEGDPSDWGDLQRYIRSGHPSLPTTHGKRPVGTLNSTSSKTKKRAKRSEHESLAAEPTSGGQDQKVSPDLEHLDHIVNQDPEHHLAAGGGTHIAHLINTVPGQASRGRSLGSKGHVIEDADADFIKYEQEIAATLLLAMRHEDRCKSK